MAEKHFSELEKLSKDKSIWKYYIFDGSDSEKFLHAMKKCNCVKLNGTEYPFVISHNSENKIIGSTRFLISSRFIKNWR
jgi:hypothetical protein